MKKVVFIFCVISSLTSCYYDNEEDLYGVSNCDIEAVSFADDILPIISDHCSSCHSGSNPSADLTLVNYSQIMESGLDTSNDGMISRIERLEGEPGLMPTNYRLEQCQINKIKAWVEQGALNN